MLGRHKGDSSDVGEDSEPSLPVRFAFLVEEAPRQLTICLFFFLPFRLLLFTPTRKTPAAILALNREPPSCFHFFFTEVGFNLEILTRASRGLAHLKLSILTI